MHGDLTLLLKAACSGDREAYARLYEAVYAELRRVAGANLRREAPGHTLQPTALVNEAYLRLADQRTGWRSRSHFFAIASQAMRRILVDHARARDSLKRGGGARLPLPDGRAEPAAPGWESGGSQVDLLALDEALGKLAAIDADSARVVEMRFFGGMEIDAIAEFMGSSERTVRRHWVYAKAWLARELSAGSRPCDGREGQR